MFEWILTYNCNPCFDFNGDYVPHKDVGRPRIKWDDYLKAFFLHHFPARANEHWSYICRSLGSVDLESDFVDFSMCS